MVGIVRILLFVLAAAILLRAAGFLLRRARLLLSFARLGRREGIAVRLRPLCFFSPFVSAPPAAEVEVGGGRYAVRLMNGGGPFRRIHFADPRFAVRFRSLRQAGRPRGGTPAGALALGGRVEVLPEPKDPAGAVPILLLSPLPAALTYVSEEKTAIRLAFTGDELYGRLVFGRESLLRFFDRKARAVPAERLFFDE